MIEKRERRGEERRRRDLSGTGQDLDCILRCALFQRPRTPDNGAFPRARPVTSPRMRWLKVGHVPVDINIISPVVRLVR